MTEPWTIGQLADALVLQCDSVEEMVELLNKRLFAEYPEEDLRPGEYRKLKADIRGLFADVLNLR